MVLLTGAFTSSCRHYPTSPTDTTKCDTCCDTCHTDTTHHPCDTCNKASDTTSHNFQWTEYNIPQESNLSGVWVFDSSHILICGDRLWDFDGNSFAPRNARNSTHNTELNGGLSGANIFALSPTDIWLIDGSAVFHTKNGINFDDIRPGSTLAVWGLSDNDMFVVGKSGQIHHYDGTKFTDMVSGTTKSIGTISGTNNQNIWAAGWNSSLGQSVVLHYDGNTWTEDPFSTSGQARDWGIGSVWCTDSTGHKITIISGSSVFRKTDDGQWRGDSDRVDTCCDTCHTDTTHHPPLIPVISIRTR
jgi:hypothetical protein